MSNITLTVPLRVDEGGVIRIGPTRVTLRTIVQSYQQGLTPFAIHSGFPTVPLADIYLVIAYYLANQAALDEQFRQEDEQAAALWRKIEANYTPEQQAFIARMRNLIEEKRMETA